MNPVTLLAAAFNATVVQVMVPTVDYPWYRCRRCGEAQLRRRARIQAHCSMTPGCTGPMEPYLIVRCEGCGEPLTGRSRDGRFCKAKCRQATASKERP